MIMLSLQLTGWGGRSRVRKDRTPGGLWCWRTREVGVRFPNVSLKIVGA